MITWLENSKAGRQAHISESSLMFFSYTSWHPVVQSVHKRHFVHNACKLKLNPWFQIKEALHFSADKAEAQRCRMVLLEKRLWLGHLYWSVSLYQPAVWLRARESFFHGGGEFRKYRNTENAPLSSACLPVTVYHLPCSCLTKFFPYMPVLVPLFF